MTTPVPSPRFVNGFVEGADLVLLYRDAAGQMLSRRRKAEWSSFYRREAVTPEVMRDLRNSSFVVGVSEEPAMKPEWLRVKWQAPEWRRKAHEPDGWAEKQGLTAFEADVTPEHRFFAETGAEVAKPRRVYLDIETDSRVPPAVARQGKARVLCWSLVDEEERVVAQGLLREDDDADEKRVLEEFWAAIDPFDQVVAWYGDGFDFPIMRLRSERLDAKRKDYRRWLWMDFLPVYERMNRNAADSGTEKESMRLQDVAMSRLNEGKNDFDASKTYEEWAAGGERRQRLVDYCAQDTRLLPKLNRKTGFLDVNDAVCAVGRLFANTESANPTNYVDGFLLRMGVERGTRFPSRAAYGRDEQEKHEKFAGALVMKEHKVRGIEKDVHVADFSGMYPSIIMTWNMSPETKVSVPVNGPIPAGTCRAPSTRCGFSTGKEGILVEALKRIKKMRSFWQKKQASLPPGTPEWVEAGRLSTAYKVIANSFYGVVGSPFSRFFDRQIAESVTQNGVWLIRKTIHAAEERGWEVVYGDSVTADRIVVARSPEGAVELLPARELWDRAAGVVAERGKEFGQLPGWRALTEKGWRPVSAIVRHRAGKPTWRITTKHGQTQVTEDHGIMVGGEQVRPSEFVEDKSLFTTVAAPPEVPEERVDLFACVKDAVFHAASRTRDHERRFVLDEDGETFYLDGWGAPAKQLRVKRWYDAGSAELGSLLRLIGIYVGDGSASVRGVTTDTRSVLSFCKSHLPTIEQVARDLRVVAPEVELWGPKWSETVYIVRSGTVAMAWLFHVLCGSKSRGKKLPPFAFKLRAEDRQALIDAFAQADGPLDQSGEMVYTTNSAKLAAGVSYVLSQHGRAHGWSFRESKGAWILRTRTRGERVNRYSIKSEVFPAADEPVYDLTVEGAHTFVDGIGRVLLHNTDSIFVKNVSREDFAAFVEWCNRELYPPAIAECGCVENHVELAYEKEFERLTMVSAKKYCNPPEAPIWMADGTFKLLGEVKPGDHVMGWVDGEWGERRREGRRRWYRRKKDPGYPPKEQKLDSTRRRLQDSVVAAVHRHVAPIVRLRFESGRELRCTADHRWKVHGRSGTYSDYMPPKVGRALSFVASPPRVLTSAEQREADWLGGIWDGEVSLSGENRGQIVMAQSRSHNPEVCARIEEAIRVLGWEFRVSTSRSGASKCDNFVLKGGLQTRLEFIEWCRPAKVEKIRRSLKRARFAKADRVVEIIPDGQGEVIGLTTSTGNYVAWGYASKNCATYAHYKWVATCECDTAKGEPGALDVKTMTCRDCGKKWDALPPPRGKPEIRGLEYKRGDVIRIARRLQLLVVEKLMKDLSEDPADFVPFVESVRDHVLTAALPVEDVRLSKSLSKSLREYKPGMKTDGTASAEPAHVQVARVLKGRGEQVGEGTKIFYYVTDASDSPMKVAPAADYANDCDRFYLWENLIYPATQRVLEAAFPTEKGMTLEALQLRDWRRFEKVRPKKARARKELEPPERVPGPAGAQKGRTRRAPVAQGGLFDVAAPTPEAPASSPAGVPALAADAPFVFVVEADRETQEGARVLLAVKEALRRYPGDRPVELQIVTAAGTAVLDVPMRVALSADLVRDVERAKGA